jgi:hypothetical protein
MTTSDKIQEIVPNSGATDPKTLREGSRRNTADRLEASFKRILGTTHSLVDQQARAIAEDRRVAGDFENSVSKQQADWYEAEDQLSDRIGKVIGKMEMQIDIAESAQPDSP